MRRGMDPDVVNLGENISIEHAPQIAAMGHPRIALALAMNLLLHWAAEASKPPKNNMNRILDLATSITDVSASNNNLNRIIVLNSHATICKRAAAWRRLVIECSKWGKCDRS